jgi:hypothetical protein
MEKTKLVADCNQEKSRWMVFSASQRLCVRLLRPRSPGLTLLGLPVLLRPGTFVLHFFTSWYNHFIMRHRNGPADLERLLAPVSRCLNVEAARKLVRLKADAKTQGRVDELARKCNEGELTRHERAEYERLVTAGNLIAILQAKARLLLAKKS